MQIKKIIVMLATVCMLGGLVACSSENKNQVKINAFQVDETLYDTHFDSLTLQVGDETYDLTTKIFNEDLKNAKNNYSNSFDFGAYTTETTGYLTNSWVSFLVTDYVLNDGSGNRVFGEFSFGPHNITAVTESDVKFMGFDYLSTIDEISSILGKYDSMDTSEDGSYDYYYYHVAVKDIPISINISWDKEYDMIGSIAVTSASWRVIENKDEEAYVIVSNNFK